MIKSIGATLKDARENLGLSLEQVINETHISKHYIEALEAEQFDVFIAETYLIGFLRNYAQFLGLDDARLIEYYRHYKLNEEPMPIKELIGPPKGTLTKKILLIGLIAAALSAMGVLGIPRLINWFSTLMEQRKANIEIAPPSQEIRPDELFWEGEVRPGDTVVLEDPKGLISIAISKTVDRLELDAMDVGRWRLLPGEEIYVPGSNNRPKWRIGMKDFGLPFDGAILEIQELPDQPSSGLNLLEDINMDPPGGNEARRREIRTILETAFPTPFILDITVQGFCLVRYKVDNQDIREKYYSNGDSIRLNAGENIVLWLSNAGALAAKIQNKDVPFGRKGEVFTGYISWVAIDEQTQALMLVPMY